MNKWLKISGIVGAVIVGVAALGIAVSAILPTSVSAAARVRGMHRFDEAALPFPPQAQFGGPGQFAHPGGPGMFGGSIDREALLAEALGITVDELQAAQEKAHTAAIQQALDQGLITQEQADLMSSRMKLDNYLDKDAMLAKALGITVEQLQQSRVDGKPLSVLIYELELDPATVRTGMQTAYEDAVQQAVSDGVISQDQADQLLDSPGRGGRGFGGRGGFGWR